MEFLKPVYLLDTNVVSEPSKPEPNIHLMSNLETYYLFSNIGATTWYELEKGVNLMPEGRRKDEYKKYNLNYVLSNFPIINYDENAASIQAEIFSRMKQNGTPVSYADSQIASIALANNMILVTRNTKDFEPIQKEFSLCVVNWFEE